MWRPRLIVLQPTPYCNIDCDYCYLRNRNDRSLMGDPVLEAVRDKLFTRMAQDAAPTIVWHAGEPTVAPISWYERAYAMLRPAAPAGAVFTLQSNGVSLSETWIEFIRRSDTRIGLSIDGPQRFHDQRRKTRAGGPTWSLVIRSLRRLQAAGLDATVISVLHPDALDAADEFYHFYREHNIWQVSFSIDEVEGAHQTSSFDGTPKRPMIEFLQRILTLAFQEGYPLHVREIERIAGRLVDGGVVDNEQVQPWQVVVVAANGDVTSFSPEFMELRSKAHNDFCFGNILNDDLEVMMRSPPFRRAQSEIATGVESCRTTCHYFEVCGGGAPANKMMENGSLGTSETLFCRLSVQSAADALLGFLSKTASKAGPKPSA